MFDRIARDTTSLLQWTWPEIAPYYQDLAARPLRVDTVEGFLADWTQLKDMVDELGTRLHVATTLNTADEEAERRYHAYLDLIEPHFLEAEQKLKDKLLDSGLQPAGMEVPLRKMRAEAATFCQANLPLLVQEHKLSNRYNQIIGAQTVQWEGEELTLAQLRPVYQDTDRTRREQAWRLAAERQLADRGSVNELWQQFLGLRRQLAGNAGFGSYRDYRWQKLARLDYTPDDCLTFQRAIAEVVVPAAQRIYERRRRRLGVKTLRPWDLDVDPLGRPALRPFSSIDELKQKAAAIFRRVDPTLGAYYDTLVSEDLLDLENRKNKAPGAYCITLPVIKRPFIFANAVGLHADVKTVLHECGHAFHSFERSQLPYSQQRHPGAEMAEVASMAMELLASPYLTEKDGGFYSEAEAARARVQHLENSTLFWPYMAVVDAFQHWVYQDPDAAMFPANCDDQWAVLWERFMPGVDWSGLEEEMKTGWQRKLHIHTHPFYYVEYGLAQLGSVLIWGKALQDQAGAVASYRHALSLGNTVPLPELYATAGAKFAFDAATLNEAIGLVEKVIAALEA